MRTSTRRGVIGGAGSGGFTVARTLARAAVMTALVLALLPKSAFAQELAQKLVPPPDSYHSFFGEALAIDGSTMVMGDFNYLWKSHPCQKEHGAIVVYKKSAGSWQRSQLFEYQNDDSVQTRLGWSVSIKGNVIAAAAPGQTLTRSDGSVVRGAGAITFYRRSSSTANFNFAGYAFAPNPVESGNFTWVMPVVTNGAYAAATGFPSRGNEVYVYRILSSSQSYATTITLPAQVNNLFITNQNILVANVPGSTTLYAYKLNGTQATQIDTSGILLNPHTLTGVMGGDGDSVAFLVQSAWSDVRSVWKATFTADALDVYSVRGYQLPPEHDWAQLRSLVMKENQAIFIHTDSFITGYRYVNGEFNYMGIVYDPEHYTSSIAYNGTDLLVGSRSESHPEANATCGSAGSISVFQPLAGSSAGPGASRKLQPWLTSAAYAEGTAVARSGSFAVSGSRDTYQGGSTTGSVNLFQNVSGTTWQHVEQYLDVWTNDFSPGSYSGFGHAVDISADFIAIGVPWGVNQDNNLITGEVQVIQNWGSRFDPNTWVNRLPQPSGALQGDTIGSSVALSGTTLFAGASAMSAQTGSQRGSVWVYDWDGSSWYLGQQILPNPATSVDFERFGDSVGASGTNLIVGIPGRESSGRAGVGAVQIFRRNSSGSYVSAGEFNAPAALQSWAGLGQRVAIGADFAAAGSFSGTVVTYRRTGTTWVQDRVITPNESSFGYSVALEGTRLVIGSPDLDRVYRYERSNTLSSGVWNRIGTLNGPAGGWFGGSVDLTGGAVMIGDPYGMTGARSSGANYTLNFTEIQ